MKYTILNAYNIVPVLETLSLENENEAMVACYESIRVLACSTEEKTKISRGIVGSYGDLRHF